MYFSKISKEEETNSGSDKISTIISEEILVALSDMKDGKAAGEVWITTEMLIVGRFSRWLVGACLLNIWNRILTKTSVRQRTGIMVLIIRAVTEMDREQACHHLFIYLNLSIFGCRYTRISSTLLYPLSQLSIQNPSIILKWSAHLVWSLSRPRLYYQGIQCTINVLHVCFFYQSWCNVSTVCTMYLKTFYNWFYY